jgi:hypothetical protein
MVWPPLVPSWNPFWPPPLSIFFLFFSWWADYSLGFGAPEIEFWLWKADFEGFNQFFVKLLLWHHLL